MCVPNAVIRAVSWGAVHLKLNARVLSTACLSIRVKRRGRLRHQHKEPDSDFTRLNSNTREQMRLRLVGPRDFIDPHVRGSPSETRLYIRL